MTARERTLSCLRGKPVDRLPVVHFGFWRDTLLKWAQEGHLTEAEAMAYEDGNDIDTLLCERFGFDHCWTCAGGANNYLDPLFEEKSIKELPDGSRHVQNSEGVIELDVPGTTSIRSEIEHTLVDRASWEKHYKWRLQWHEGRAAGLDTWSPPDQDRPLGLWCGSLIGRIRNMLGVEGLAYLGADDPELLDEIVDTMGALCLRGVEEALQRVDQFDFAHFWEDICYNHGPLVNPRFFAAKIVPWYRKITTVLNNHGIDLISVDCDGCIDALVPLWLDAGVNIMFPIEVGTWNASIAHWREQCGKALKGIGGMRKNVFAEDKAAIDAEIGRLRPLIALGGYIPCPDHRIPPEAKWDLVRYYAERIAGLPLDGSSICRQIPFLEKRIIWQPISLHCGLDKSDNRLNPGGMKYRKLGNSDIEVSEISLGCWTMGGLNWVNGNPNGWADVNEEEIAEGIRKAVDAGVNHFDNADVYGNGKAERMLARVLKKLGLKSEDFVIATKIGHFPGTAEHAYEPAHIRHQCEQSLINLQRDYIDIYYFHHGNFGPHLEEAAATMDALVAEGKVRLKGQSAYSSSDFTKAVPVVKPAVLQSWANITDPKFIRKGTPVARMLEEHNMSFVAFSPLAQGRLLGKFDPDNPPQFEEGDHRKKNPAFTAEGLRKLQPKIEAIQSRFGDSVETLSAVAQRFVLNHPHVACTIPGFRNAKQVTCNLAADTFDLSEPDMDFLRKLFD